MKKLYKCEYTLVFYTLADTPEDAQDMLGEVIETESHSESNVYVEQIRDPNHIPTDTWDKKSIVYGDGNQTTLGNALKGCNKP